MRRFMAHTSLFQLRFALFWWGQKCSSTKSARVTSSFLFRISSVGFSPRATLAWASRVFFRASATDTAGYGPRDMEHFFPPWVYRKSQRPFPFEPWMKRSPVAWTSDHSTLSCPSAGAGSAASARSVIFSVLSTFTCLLPSLTFLAVVCLPSSSAVPGGRVGPPLPPRFRVSLT